MNRELAYEKMNWIQKIATGIFLIMLTWVSLAEFIFSLVDYLNTLPIYIETMGWLMFLYIGINGLSHLSSKKTIVWPESDNNE